MNVRELMSELSYNDCNVAELAQALGLSKTTIYRKLSGQTDFTCSEIEKLKSHLELSDEKLLKIFFA